MIFKNKEKRSLIMCATPLQMLIAEKIIELSSDEVFDLLVVALNDNNKYRYYYSKLKEKCSYSFYYVPQAGIYGFFKYVNKIKLSDIACSYNKLYLASIDLRHFQYIVSTKRSENVYTFDDGTANIMPSSLYYRNEEPILLKKLVWRTFGIKHYIKNIKDLSSLHYTIYKDLPNIIENREYVSLVLKDNFAKSEINSLKVKFYLGQPIDDDIDILSLDFIKESIDKLSIDYYYPHPREKNYPEGGFELIESPLIFEDYISQFLADNPNVNVEVFSVISTALLNIKSINRLKVSYVHNSKIFKLYKDFYIFAKESFNIPNIDVDEEIQ